MAWSALICAAAAERINQEGRILGDQVPVTQPLLFNTAEADAALASMQIMPRDSAWNEDISRRPVLANSDAMIARIMADLRSDRRTLRAFHEMNFVLVPDNQSLVPIRFFNWPEESDPSPYPIPSNMPVETWPRETGSLTLSEWQRDINDDGGDRHSIVVMPGSGFIWETWLTRLVNNSWEASNGAKFDLKSNTLRPFGWTSGDAAGLPMFPALVRYDECERGMVEHAMRIVVGRSRLGPIYPATHHASVGNLTDPNIPAMGQRVRLKAGFVIPSNWTKQEKAVLLGLKKYGALVADNGNFFSISVTPDQRYPSGAFSRLSSISITNFEVIQTTGANEGPRSPGAPRSNAGEDFVARSNEAVPLSGAVLFTNNPATLRTEWRKYSGPGTVTFSDALKTNATATFTAPGEYILMLSADDQIHTISYDAVKVTVTDSFLLRVNRQGNELMLTWIGGTAPFAIEKSPALSPAVWAPLSTVTSNSARVPISGGNAFFRIRSAN